MKNNKTVLLTGATGFLGKHIAVQLLNSGYDVVGTSRSPDKLQEVIDAIAPHLKKTETLHHRLRLIALDLDRDDGWDAAMQGIDVVIHSAAAVPFVPPKNEDDLIRPTVKGTLRALESSHRAGIQRFIMTSSTLAITHGSNAAEKLTYDEADWTDANSAHANAYVKAKTIAERAAWDFVRNKAPQMKLTVINPGMIFGPPLDQHFGASIQLVERLLKRVDPVIPQFGFPIVDVRDVAKIHVRAISTPESINKRFVASDQFLWFGDMADTLAMKYPARKITTRRAPNFVVRIAARFDPSLRSIVPNLGKQQEVSNERIKRVMNIEFIDAKHSLLASADFLVRKQRV